MTIEDSKLSTIKYNKVTSSACAVLLLPALAEECLGISADSPLKCVHHAPSCFRLESIRRWGTRARQGLPVLDRHA